MILLKRPGKILQNISDIRFLLIIFEVEILIDKKKKKKKKKKKFLKN